MNPKLQDFLRYCENRDSMVLFFRLAGELLEHLQLPDDREKVVLNVTKGANRRMSFDLNSRLVLTLYQDGKLGFMLGREFIDLHRTELEIDYEAEFTNKEPIASIVSFPYDFVSDRLDLFKNEWLKCCKEYSLRNERSPYLKNHMPELLKYVREPELILSEEVAADKDSDGKYFKDLMNSLKAYIDTTDSVLNDFSIEKNTKKYCWISDKHELIGGLIAHYEIYRDGKNMFVDLHFEDKETKSVFQERIGDLPPGLNWMKWHNAKSIRTEGHVDLYDSEALKKLSDKLLFLEESIGDKVRAVVKTIKPIQENITHMKSSPLNLILYGPPGTGKTYNSINKALCIIDPGFDLTQNRKLVKAEFDKYVAEGRIAFTTFHQSMSYEDFIEGIKPQPPGSETNKAVTYDIDAGIFKSISKRACQTNLLTVSIDEEELSLTKELFTDFYKQFAAGLPDFKIESSNVILKTSKGKEFELFRNTAGSITIKAGVKRTDMSVPVTELTKVLFENKPPWYPSYEHIIIDAILNDKSFKSDGADYSKLKFVLIIDEINRGNIAQIFGELITLIEEDKRLGNEESLEAILTYSKEKFGVPPNLYIIGTMNTADRSVEALDTALRRRFSFEEVSPNPGLLIETVEGIVLRDLLVLINKRIEKLLDKDHQIGHSYFMKVSTLNDLRIVFSRNIIPLLQEYFFGDFGKIGLVLGTGFFEVYESGNTFAEFFDYEKGELEERPVYKIKRVMNMSNEEFKSALETLIKNA